MNSSLTPYSCVRYLWVLVVCTVFTGCASTAYTTDDGSAVDEKLLSSIRLYGKGEQALRPSIVKSAQLKDEGCSKQWELPFVVAASHELPRMEKIAWVRGLQVDERLSVVAATDESGLQVGDKITEINGDADDPDDLLEELIDQRDSGKEFEVTLSTGRKLKVAPVEVCRGHVEITKPADPDKQDYHWLKSTHRMAIFEQDLTADEIMWMVLWTQGLSEEAGMRMKTYHYGMNLFKTTLTVASIASGVGAVAGAAQAAAANVAASEAGKAAAQAAGKAVAKYAAEQVADSMRQKMIEAGLKEAGKAAAQEIAIAAVASAGLFKSSLSGIAWVAGTGFWMADKWALDRMAKLGADPLAAYTLHFKLASRSQADNAFVLDEERLAKMTKYAEEGGFSDLAKLALAGQTGMSIAEGSEAIEFPAAVEVRPLAAVSASPVIAASSEPLMPEKELKVASKVADGSDTPHVMSTAAPAAAIAYIDETPPVETDEVTTAQK